MSPVSTANVIELTRARSHSVVNLDSFFQVVDAGSLGSFVDVLQAKPWPARWVWKRHVDITFQHQVLLF